MRGQRGSQRAWFANVIRLLEMGTRAARFLDRRGGKPDPQRVTDGGGIRQPGGVGQTFLAAGWGDFPVARWSLDISLRSLPEGDLTIARQFTAGLAFAVARVPKGRLNPPMPYVGSYSHCVFSTKDRRPFITPKFRDRLWPYLGGMPAKTASRR